MSDALKMYGIGPVVQVLLAPVVALTKAKMVEQVALLRDAAIYIYWLFAHPGFSQAEKRDLASAYLERWGGDAAAGAAVIAEAAVDAAGSVRESTSR